MLGLLFKFLKYIIVIIAIGIIYRYMSISYEMYKNNGFNILLIPILLLPINLFLIYRLIAKRGIIFSLTLTGYSILSIIFLIINERGKEILNSLSQKMPFKLTEDNIVQYFSLLTSIIVISYLIFSFVKKKKKLENSTYQKRKNKKNPFSFVFKSAKKTIHIDNPFRGIYIQGSAGSGKSETFIKPIIQQVVKANYSGILYDFKSPELSEEYFYRINQLENNTNVTPHFVDFKNPLLSERVNPIKPSNILKSSYAFEFSEVIMTNLNPKTIKEKEWYDRDAQSVLSALIWFMKKNHKEHCTLPHIISLILHLDIELLVNEISKDLESAGMVSSLKQALDRKAEKQVSAIVSTLRNLLSRINNADIFWILSGDDFSLNLNDPQKPKLLCLGNDSTLPTVYAPAISLITSVATRLMNEPNKHHSILILDEAPTIYIPSFERIPAVARSNKIATVYAVQDYSQITDSLGDQKAQVVLSNLGNQIYGRTSNSKTAEMIKNLFSKRDITFETEGKNSGTSGEFIHLSSNKAKSKNQSIQERDRAKISDIINMSPGEFYGVVAEGNIKEFLKEKFKQNRKEDISYSFKEKTTHKHIEENYIKIVNEAKNLFKKPESKEEKKGVAFEI